MFALWSASLWDSLRLRELHVKEEAGTTRNFAQERFQTPECRPDLNCSHFWHRSAEFRETNLWEYEPDRATATLGPI